MQESTRQNYKLISIFIATLAAGLPLWTQTAGQIDFTDTVFLAWWLAIGTFASFFTLFVANLKTRDMIGTFIIRLPHRRYYLFCQPNFDCESNSQPVYSLFNYCYQLRNPVRLDRFTSLEGG